MFARGAPEKSIASDGVTTPPNPPVLVGFLVIVLIVLGIVALTRTAQGSDPRDVADTAAPVVVTEVPILALRPATIAELTRTPGGGLLVGWSGTVLGAAYTVEISDAERPGELVGEPKPVAGSASNLSLTDSEGLPSALCVVVAARDPSTDRIERSTPRCIALGAEVSVPVPPQSDSDHSSDVGTSEVPGATGSPLP